MLKQWFLKISQYSAVRMTTCIDAISLNVIQELLSDLDKLQGWPAQVKSLQKNWIGKSDGAIINFTLKNKVYHKHWYNLNLQTDFISIFTTRVDTIYGVTYIALSP